MVAQADIKCPKCGAPADTKKVMGLAEIVCLRCRHDYTVYRPPMAVVLDKK